MTSFDRPSTGQPDGVTRRHFIGGSLAAVGAATVVPTWLASAAGAATPVAPTDGIVVVVTLGGGNDGLNTVAPIIGPLRGPYEQLRGAIAIPAGSLLPAAGNLGFNPALPKLAARFAQGKVAIVQGTGQTGTLDLSHFTSMGTVMAGTSTAVRTTGWLGRFLDGVTEWESGLRGVSIGTGVPLHLVGSRAKVTGMPATGALWGSDLSARWERSAYDAVRAMATTTGLGAMADRAAAVQKDAIDQAATIGSILTPAPAQAGFAGELTIAARLLNAGLGTRVVAATLGGWDTHAGQLAMQGERLGQLDAGIDAFFRELRPEVAVQTTMVVVSEFGRRASVNGSLGTDHGAASHTLVIGDRVRGGLHGAYPSLTALDASGSLVPTVDFRSVYATVIERWLRADGQAIVGPYEQLDLFTSTPGA